MTSQLTHMLLENDLPADQVVQELMKLLPCESTVFDFGAGVGRNAIPLLQAGYVVHVQEKTKAHLDMLTERVDTRNLRSRLMLENVGDAVTHKLHQSYDAFLCIRLLHFLTPEHGRQLIETMQSHTNLGGYNVIYVFTSETEHLPQWFFPSVQEIKHLYHGWNSIWESEQEIKPPSTSTNGRSMVGKWFLFSKI